MSSPELDWRPSACNLCYINCGIEVGVDCSGPTERIVKIRGDKAHPRSQGYLCNKAQAIASYVHHRDRLTSPLRRRADVGMVQSVCELFNQDGAKVLYAEGYAMFGRRHPAPADAMAEPA